MCRYGCPEELIGVAPQGRRPPGSLSGLGTEGMDPGACQAGVRHGVYIYLDVQVYIIYTYIYIMLCHLHHIIAHIILYILSYYIYNILYIYKLALQEPHVVAVEAEKAANIRCFEGLFELRLIGKSKTCLRLDSTALKRSDRGLKKHHLPWEVPAKWCRGL